MSLYDTIIQELKCPVTGKTSSRNIQIKWAEKSLKEYKIGDNIDFAKNMSLWIRDMYVCDDCELLMDEKYHGWRIVRPEGGVIYPKTSDCPHGRPAVEEYSHRVYINIQKGRIAEIVSEPEFIKRGLTDFLDADELII